MSQSGLLDEIQEAVRQLSPPLQRKVLDYANRLRKPLPKGTLGADLSPFIGILSDEEADAMLKIIDENCEQVDPHEW